MTTADIRSAFCNVPRKVGPENWRECFELTAARGDIFGFNETHAGQRKVYRREAKAAGLKMRAMRTPNPVFFDPEIYGGRGTQVIRIHDQLPALAGRFPGYNSARYVTLTHLVHKASDVRVTVAFTHLVPNGRKVNTRQRFTARRKSFRTLRQLQREATRNGEVFILMGDTNYQSQFNMGGRFRWLKGRGIDKIGYALKLRKYKVLASGAHTFRAPTDHKNGVAARVKVETR